MPQKSRSKKQARKTPAPRPVESQTPVTVTQSPQTSFTGTGTRSFATEFNPDYSQTIKDLKRIGILAGTFFAVLIVLAFVLP